MLALAHLLLTGALPNRSPFLAAFRDSDFFATPCNLPRYHPDHNRSAAADWSCNTGRPRDYFTPLVLRSGDTRSDAASGPTSVPMGHLPFFTGCTGGVADENGNVPLDRVFSDPEHCHLVPEEETVPIGEWAVTATKRVSDVCSYSMTCTHAEPTEDKKRLPFWNTEPKEGKPLFWLSFDPQNSSELLSEVPTTWPTEGMDEELAAIRERFPSGYFETTRRMLSNERFMAVRMYEVPAIIHGNPFGGIFHSNPGVYEEMGVNASASIAGIEIWDPEHDPTEWMLRRMRNDYYSCPEPYPSGTACYPRKVTLVVKYWQKRMSDGALRQRLVTAKVFLEDWALLPTRAADGHASRPTYELSIAFVPADWIEILQYFALGGTTYILFYLVIGFVLSCFMLVFWGIVRIMDAFLPPCKETSFLPAFLRPSQSGTATPALRFLQFQRLHTLPSCFAMLAISMPLVSILNVVKTVVVAPNAFGFLVGELSEFTNPRDPTAEQMRAWKGGRVGFIMFEAGILALYDSIRLWVPDGSAPRHTVSEHRFRLVVNTVGYVIFMFLAFEFTLSPLYALSPSAFWGMGKGICMFLEWRVAKTSGNAIYFPQVMLLEITAYIFTGGLAAANFLAAVMTQLVEVSVNIFRRIFIEPPKGRLLSRVHVDASVKRATTQAPPPPADGDGDAAVPGLPMPKQAAREAFQPPPRLLARGAEDEDDAVDDTDLGLRHTLIIWCTDTAALYIEVLMILAMYLFRLEFNLEEMYNKRSADLVYFMLFIYFLLPASWVEDAFTNNINEAIWKWDAIAYMQRQADRFKRRQHVWALSAPAADERKKPWERLDRVLMTNQLWLLLMLYGVGGMLTMLGFTMILRTNPRVWIDPIFLPLVFIVWGLWAVLRFVARKVYTHACTCGWRPLSPRSGGHQRV